MNYERWTESEVAALKAAVLAGTPSSKIIIPGRDAAKVRRQIYEQRQKGALPPAPMRPDRVVMLKPNTPPRSKAKVYADHAVVQRMRTVLNAEPIEREPEPLADRFREGYLGQHGRLTILGVSRETCRFPIDGKREQLFCGDVVESKGPYCDHHAERCYT